MLIEKRWSMGKFTIIFGRNQRTILVTGLNGAKGRGGDDDGN